MAPEPCAPHDPDAVGIDQVRAVQDIAVCAVLPGKEHTVCVYIHHLSRRVLLRKIQHALAEPLRIQDVNVHTEELYGLPFCSHLV